MARPRRRTVVRILAVVLAMLIADAVVLDRRIGRFEARLSGSDPGGTTYLLLGSDQRDDYSQRSRGRFGTAAEVSGARADIVVLIRMDERNDEVRALGIPRDLVLIDAARGPNRVTIMFRDGAGAVASALCQSLGIGVDHVVVATFGGFASLVRLAGGIDVESDVRFRDPTLAFQMNTGVNRLGADAALSYVRTRTVETLRDGEWRFDATRSAQRPERAAGAVRSLAERLAPNLVNPITLHRVAWTAGGAVSTDDGTGWTDLRALKNAAERVTPEQMRTLPVSLVDGETPIAQVTRTSAATVDWFLGTRVSPQRCPTAAVLSSPGG